MNKALIIHHSKTGTTLKFGREIADFCNQQDINSSLISIEEYTKNETNKYLIKEAIIGGKIHYF